MAICDGIWEAVRNVLCFDAPEGTSILDEEAEDVTVGTKDSLSYCWRALKESRSVVIFCLGMLMTLPLTLRQQLTDAFDDHE